MYTSKVTCARMHTQYKHAHMQSKVAEWIKYTVTNTITVTHRWKSKKNYRNFIPTPTHTRAHTKKMKVRGFQVELVPLMRSYETYSCEDVKERAYRSHAACYTNPFKDARTICEMPSVDFWHVFWIIRSAFISSYSEALFGLLKVSWDNGWKERECLEDYKNIRWSVGLSSENCCKILFYT